MERIVVCFFLAATLCSLCCSSSVTPFYTFIDDKLPCVTEGNMCEDCESLVYCFQNSDGSFEKYPIETCDTNSSHYCLAGNCTDEPNPFCPERNYMLDCRDSLGMFPHPYDCRKFFMCTKTSSNGTISPYQFICNGDYGYNMTTTYCDVPLPNGCDIDNPPVPICKYVGQIDALDNPTLYYLCVKGDDEQLEPHIFMCPNGKMYIKEYHRCE